MPVHKISLTLPPHCKSVSTLKNTHSPHNIIWCNLHKNLLEKNKTKAHVKKKTEERICNRSRVRTKTHEKAE